MIRSNLPYHRRQQKEHQRAHLRSRIMDTFAIPMVVVAMVVAVMQQLSCIQVSRYNIRSCSLCRLMVAMQQYNPLMHNKDSFNLYRMPILISNNW